MIHQHLHPPLTAVEKTLVDAFCIWRPCQPLRALYKHTRLNQDGNRDAFYAGCQYLCTRVHFCPLEGGLRYRGFAKSEGFSSQIDRVV
jgi:hypothetical protein